MANPSGDASTLPVVEGEYRGIPEFENNPENLNQALMLLCPEILNQAKNQPIVSKTKHIYMQ